MVSGLAFPPGFYAAPPPPPTPPFCFDTPSFAWNPPVKRWLVGNRSSILWKFSTSVVQKLERVLRVYKRKLNVCVCAINWLYSGICIHTCPYICKYMHVEMCIYGFSSTAKIFSNERKGNFHFPLWESFLHFVQTRNASCKVSFFSCEMEILHQILLTVTYSINACRFFPKFSVFWTYYQSAISNFELFR